jgi:hypothetical protein
MTAPIGTNANRFTGLRERSDVTNSYGGYLTSAGSAYSLTLPFVPDRFDWWRYTGFGTAGVLGSGVWFRDFPAGDSLIMRSIADNGVTGNTSQLLEAANGITDVSTSGGFIMNIWSLRASRLLLQALSPHQQIIIYQIMVALF